MSFANEATDNQRVVLSGVTKSFVTDSGSTVQAVAPTDLVFEPGEFVCLVGPSGCGKSSLLNMLAGFSKPTSGEIRVGDHTVKGPDAERGVVFQQPNLFPWLTVRGNVELGPRMRGVSAAKRREQTDHFLKMVGLEQFADHKPYELSGGMQQRCQIARVLNNDPNIVLMDEPFGALDALTRERLQLELLEIWREKRKTVFFITHSVEEAIFLGTRVLVMSARPGQIILDQSVDLGGPDGGPEIRSLPEFVELRDKVSRAVYAAQGVHDTVPSNH